MVMTTFSSREFNQDVSKVKRAAMNGPVFITDRGHVAYVLLEIGDYKKMVKKKESIIDLIAMPADSPDIDFDPAPSRGKFFRPVDFS
jgi:hypothetical protein